jgi:Ca-activated chloride channel family protein
VATSAVNNAPATPTSTRRSAISNFLVRLRGRSQSGLYALVGTIAGLLGAVLAGTAVLLAGSALRTAGNSVVSESLLLVLTTGLKFGVLASVLSALLFMCIRWYHRRRFTGLMALAVAASGFIAGAIPASLIQLLVNAVSDSRESGNPTVVAAVLILLGGLLGTGLSRFMPNLQPNRGLFAGLAAGLVAGLFSGTTAALGMPSPSVFLIGCAILGAALGFAMSLAESRFRESMIEIHWDSEQSTRLGLGSKPVTIGGGKDDIFIHGAPEHVSSITMRNGQAEHVETSNGKCTALKDGSRLRVGSLIMVVRVNPRAVAPVNLRNRGKT